MSDTNASNFARTGTPLNALKSFQALVQEFQKTVADETLNMDAKVSQAAASATSAISSASSAADVAALVASKSNSATAASENATAAKTAASNSAKAAATSATTAGSSAATATSKATAAATSAAQAQALATSLGNFDAAVTASQTAATTATNRATAASTSATNAATSATNSANSATAAATSATNAANTLSSLSTALTPLTSRVTAIETKDVGYDKFLPWSVITGQVGGVTIRFPTEGNLFEFSLVAALAGSSTTRQIAALAHVGDPEAYAAQYAYQANEFRGNTSAYGSIGNAGSIGITSVVDGINTPVMIRGLFSPDSRSDNASFQITSSFYSQDWTARTVSGLVLTGQRVKALTIVPSDGSGFATGAIITYRRVS